MDFEPLDRQSKELEKRYEYVSANFDMSNQRLRSIMSYFDKIKTTYLTFNKKFPPFTHKGFERCLIMKGEKPLAPGNPGLQKINVLSIFEVINSVIRDTSYTANFLQENVISTLNDTCSSREKIFDDYNAKYSASLSKRNTLSQTCVKDQEQLNATISKLDKLRSDLNYSIKTNQKPKIITKMRGDIGSLCDTYRTNLRTLELDITKFNNAQKKFVNITTEAINEFISIEGNKVATIYQILNQFPNAFKVVGDLYQKLNAIFIPPKQKWEDDFKKFVYEFGICRSSYVPIVFKPFTFSFDDPQFVKPIVSTKQYLEAPLSFATVKCDFNANTPIYGNLPNMIFANANETLYVYDNNKHKYVLVSKSPNGPKGYFPLENLIFGKEKIVIVQTNQLKTTEDSLEIQTGEIVLVMEDASENEVICQKITGEKGKVNKECLIFGK